jgi:hypothetical protein
MELKQHYNYVGFVSGGLIKIGRTSSPSARLRRLRAQAGRHGRTMTFELGSPVSGWIALNVESAVRRVLRPFVVVGTYEWVMGGEDDAREIVAMTARMQRQAMEASS